MSLFWLSFCDPDRPPGSQFVGAAIVRAPDFLTAVTLSHVLGCNPGGEVAGVEVPEERAHLVPTDRIGVLMTRAELDELDKEIERRRLTPPAT